MESPTAASPSLPPNKSIFPEQDVSRVALRRHSVDKTSRSGSISLKPTENRELANENNILHKENERKEHRIQALTKEIQSLRVTHTNDQRELKLMANTIDLLKKEKGQLEQERRHSLSKQQQLQHLLDQHQQSKTLLEANERLLKEIDGLKLTISSQQGELLLRKEEIGRLTEELQVAALTIQTQNNYDNAIFYDQLAPTSTSLPVKTNLSLSFGKNREVLKQLYFDLSKKTVNNQSLSEELAATARSHHLLRDTHSQTLTQLQQVREERDRLLLEREEVLRRCEESDRERQALTQRLKDESDAVQQREKQLSELTRRLTEYRVTSEQQRHELGYELTEARKEVQRAEDASQRLRQTIETMSAEEQRLQQLLVETRQLYEEEKKHFLEQQRRLSEEVRALHEVRKRCEEVQVALEQKEVMCQQLQKRCEEVEQEKYEVKGKVSYVSYHLQKERDASAQLQSQYDHLLAAHRKQEQEKEEVLQAFQQLLRTSKELVTQHEEAKREIATLQQRVEEVQAVRENMNSAILNALFDERMKSMISKQMDADAVLKQQLQAQQLPPHTLPHTLPRQSQQVLLGYATLRTPSEQMEEVEARIARGDFDWLNDDHVIHSVLNESLTQARAMGGVTPAITKETDTSEHERNPILIELEKFQQEISQLHATPTGPPLNTTINNNNNNSNNKDKNASYTSHTSSHSSGSRSQQLPPPPPQPSQPLPHTTTPVNISHMTSHTPPQPSQPSQLSSYSLSYSPYNNTTLLSPPINTTSTNNNPNTTTPQLPPQPLTQLGELPMNNTPINNNNNKLTTPHNTNSGNNSNSSHSYHSQPHQPSGGGGGGGVISNLLDITLASDVTHSRVMEGSGLAMTLTQSKDHSSNSNSTTSHTNSNNSRGSNSSRSNSDVSLVIDQLSEVIATKTSTTNTPHYTTLPQPLPQPLPQHLPSYATTTTYHSRSSSEGELSNNSNTNLTNNSHHSHSTTSSWNLSYLTNPANPVINSNNK